MEALVDIHHLSLKAACLGKRYALLVKDFTSIKIIVGGDQNAGKPFLILQRSFAERALKLITSEMQYSCFQSF